VPVKLWNLKIRTLTWPHEYGYLWKEDPSAWIWVVSYSVNLTLASPCITMQFK